MKRLKEMDAEINDLRKELAGSGCGAAAPPLHRVGKDAPAVGAPHA
jgi:hypothetical protein